MSFLNVYKALYNQILADSTLLTYIDPDDIEYGFTAAKPRQQYVIYVEPLDETELPAKDYPTGNGSTKMVQYDMQIACFWNFPGKKLTESIIGYTDTTGTFKPGILQFSADVKSAIQSDMTLGYNRNSGVLSSENVSGTFVLTASNRYISVSINSKTPTGYDTVFCGDSSLSGSDIATNIQASLRSLGSRADDGYYYATCTFDDSNNQFTIRSGNCDPADTVSVSAGSSDDCSSILGFDSTTAQSGRNITKIEFGPTTKNSLVYPIRIRFVNVSVFEEVVNINT